MLQDIFQRFTYPLMLSMFIVALGEILKFFLRYRLELKKYYYVLLSSLVLTTVVAVSVRHEFRTLSDETNILSSSQSMVFRKSPENILTSESWYGILNPTTGLIPKRPVLFPFLMSLTHTFVGFKVFAGVYVNIGILFVLLFLIGLISRQLFGLWGTIGIQLLLLSHPVISLYATSGGFDFSSAVFIIICILLAHVYINSKTKNNLNLLLIFLTMLCHCRYESFAYAIAIIGLLVCFRHIKIKDLFSGFSLLCLVFFSPIVIQRIISVGQYEQPEGAPLFSLEYFRINVLAFINNFFRSDLFLPYNMALFTLFVAGILPLVGFLIWEKIDSKSNKRLDLAIVYTVVSLINLAIIFLHVAGDITANTQVRYFIPLCIFTVFMFVIFARKFNFNDKTVFISGFISFLIFHPIAVEDRMHQQLILNRELKFEMEFINNLKTNNILIISERAGMFTAQRIPSISFEIANIKGKKAQVTRALREHLYDKAIVFQHYYYDKGVAPFQSLPKWKLKPIMKRQLSYDHYVQISEVSP